VEHKRRLVHDRRTNVCFWVMRRAPAATSVRRALLNLPAPLQSYVSLAPAAPASTTPGDPYRLAKARSHGHQAGGLWARGSRSKCTRCARRPTPRTMRNADEARKDTIQQNGCFAVTLARRGRQWSVVVSRSGRGILARGSSDGAQGEDAHGGRANGNLAGTVSWDHPERHSLKHKHHTAAPQ